MTRQHVFHASILREYDIRGIVGETLTEADYRAVGAAFGTVVRRRNGYRVCVGYDGRLSSPVLEQALVDGLVSAGIHVERHGLGPTPMVYFAVKYRHADAGVIVTGSHNPPDYNGVKMVLNSGPFYGRDIQTLGRLAAQGDWEHGTGSVRQVDVSSAYIERLQQDYLGGIGLTVAWDAGNGATAAVLGRLTAALPGRHVLLYDAVDGRFPHHHPDPTVPENLVDLQRVVRENGCDLGVAFDGDGDRIGAVDGTGRIVWGDQLVAIFAGEVLADRPGATVIADVKASQTLFDEVTRLGGTPLMWKTGHSLLKAKMAETGAPLAGEMSGHIFFNDRWYGFDDALYGAVRLIDLVARSGIPLAALRERLPVVFNTPEIRLQTDEARKFAVVEEVRARVADDPKLQVVDIDGVRVLSPDGWWLLRASNTQDVLVARAESSSVEGLERLKHSLAEQLAASSVAVPSDL